MNISSLPISIHNKYLTIKETLQLRQIPTLKINTKNLIKFNYEELRNILYSPAITENWNQTLELRKKFEIPDHSLSANSGDRRAIYHLANGLKYQSVLEIGTHIGASTSHLCLAIKDTGYPKLKTLDVENFSDKLKRPWINYNAKYSPKEIVTRIDCSHFVTFVVANSFDFMKNCQEKFDFIFLDGDHRASSVYYEAHLASRLLNKNGMILLHDYFPKNKPLWPNIRISPGPFLAGKRVLAENKRVRILPLGELPWPTKLNSNFTSLAMVVASNNKEA